MATTQVAKWGNSLGLRIPKAVAESARLREGDPVDLAVTKDRTLVVRPARRRYNLNELVSRITARNRHKETNWGRPVGKALW